MLIPATALASIGPISSVGTGEQFTCVLAEPSAGNKVYCFGAGDAGQLGDGKGTASAAPVAVQGLRETPRITQLLVGQYSACVVYDSSGPGGKQLPIHCWGGLFGETPAEVPENGATVVSVGVSRVSATVGQAVLYWDGLSSAGIIVLGITGASSIVSVAVGDSFVCVVLS
jgi:hypothetical protein